MPRTALAFLLALLLAACAALPGRIEPPRVTLADVRPSQVGLLEQRFRLSLRIQNPNDLALPLEGLDFAVQINGKPFATGVSNRGVTVPALGEAVMEVDAVSNLGGILRQLADLEGGAAGRGLSYRVSGKVHVTGHGAVPFEHSGDLGLPALPTPQQAPPASPAPAEEGIRL